MSRKRRASAVAAAWAAAGLFSIGAAAAAAPAAGTAGKAGTAEKASKEKPAPRIQIAILLDTSNSMDGLIDQAKTRLWGVVNEFATAKRDGVRPILEVALYEYGNQGLDAAKGWIRPVSPLTDDLDRISEALFALRTNGGDEYCGQVIREAARDLKWSASKDDLRTIYIAGNEPFTQGPVDYHDACKEAIAKGITVNTIHCGDEASGVSGGWRDGATLADGAFACIDQNRKIEVVAAPQDKEIAALNDALNRTYVPFGANGAAGAARQWEQDRNAAVNGAGVAGSRAAVKSSAQYRNDSWDLVDAAARGTVKVEEVKAEDLPAEMRAMTPEQRKSHVESKNAERQRIQDQVKKLASERDAFVAAETKKRGEAGGNVLDKAINDSLRKQAEAKSFKF